MWYGAGWLGIISTRGMVICWAIEALREKNPKHAKTSISKWEIFDDLFNIILFFQKLTGLVLFIPIKVEQIFQNDLPIHWREQNSVLSTTSRGRR